MSTTSNPQRGEVWRVQLEPTHGSEQGKTRPVVVLSPPRVGRATMRLCAPLMNALPAHNALFWCVGIVPHATNGLHKNSTADAAQTRALDIVRFEMRLGKLDAEELELIADALALCVKPLSANS